MVQAGGILLLGLVCQAARLSAGWKITPAAVPSDKHHHKGHGARRTGSSQALRSFVKMAPSGPDSVETRWSPSSLRSHDLALKWTFSTSRTLHRHQAKYNGTVMLVISPTKHEPQRSGRFLGIDENFVGLAVFVDTRKERPLQHQQELSPAHHQQVAIVANNGTRSYDDLVANLDGCTANMKFDFKDHLFERSKASRIRLKADGNMVALDIDPRHEGVWQRCATIAPGDMPFDWASESYVGVVLQTPEISNNHVYLNTLVENIPNGPWETDTDREGRGTPPTHVEHHHAGVVAGDPASIRERRVRGKRALKEACLDNDDFARCHQDRGSALELEKCVKDSGRTISERCKEGIETWKALLTLTAPRARNISPAGHKKSPPVSSPSLSDSWSPFSHAMKTSEKKGEKPSPVAGEAVLRGYISGHDLAAAGVGSAQDGPARLDGIQPEPAVEARYRVSSKERLHRDEMTPTELALLSGGSDGGWGYDDDDFEPARHGGLRTTPPKPEPKPKPERRQHDTHGSGPPSPNHRGGHVSVRSGASDIIEIKRNRSRHRQSEGWSGCSIVLFMAVLTVGGFYTLYLVLLIFLSGVDYLAQLGQRGRGRAGGRGDVTPRGYRRLAASGQQWGGGRLGGASARGNVDDAVVVTGTPVNPPPSVNL